MPLFRRQEQFAARFLILLGSSGLALSTQAQGPVDGALRIIVRQVDGRPAQGIKVTVQAGDTGLRRVTPTDKTGQALFSNLRPGSWRVTLADSLSPQAELRQVNVALGETTVITAGLRALGVPEVITVAAGPEGAGSGAVGETEIAAMPAPGLRWQDAALTQPGVLPDQDADGLLSVHGLPSTQNSLLLDGVEQNQSYGSVPVGTGSDAAPDPAEDSDSAEFNTGPSQGLSRSRHAGLSYGFSQAAVREFRVTTQNYSALVGNAAGGVVTTVSKSGTAQLHGTGFFVLRSQAFAATNPLSVATSYANGVATDELVKPHDLRENFGGTLGGPVAPGMFRARPLFYFGAFDQQRRGFPAISSPANPAFFSLTPLQLGLLATRGVKTAAIGSALNYLSSLTGSAPRRADQEIGFGRLDWTATAKEDLGLQYNAVRWDSPAGLTDAPVVARGRASLGNAAGSLDSVLARATSTFKPHWINQVRVQYLRDTQFETPQTNLPQEPAIGPGGLAPEVNIGPDGLLFGTPANLARQAYPDERRIEGGDTMTVQWHRHVVQFGGSVSAVQDSVSTLGNGEGTFRYDSGRTTANAGGLVDFITDYTFNVSAYPNGGCPSITSPVHVFCFTSFSQSFGEQNVDFSTLATGLFVEDAWSARGFLQVHLGLRYESLRLPLPQAPNAALDAVFGARGATSSFPEDRNNLGPRVGVSWQPFGAAGGVVRVGYGLYFGRLPGATIESALANTGLAGAHATTRVRITPAVETVCPQVTGQGFGYPCSFLAQPSGVVASTGSAMVFARDFRLPVVQQGSFGVERSAGRRVTLTASYEMNLDRQLASSTDMNIAPSTGTRMFQIQGGAGAKGVTPGQTFVLPAYTARVSTAFGPVTEIVSHVNGSYNGLTLAAAVRGGRSFTARASYAWSKAIDYGANLSATPRTNGQLDPFSNGYDKGLSALNYPQALHVSGVWRPVVHGQAELLRKALNGWEVAPIVLVHSGRPYSYDLYGGTELSGGHLSLNGSGGALYLPTVGRNTLRLPVSANADLRVGREFAGGRLLPEGMRARLSAEVFNVTNRLNITSVEERAFLVGTAAGGVTPLVYQDAAAIAAEGLNTQAFGTVTAANSSLARERQIQLSLKVEF